MAIPSEYKVKKPDTVWSIARDLLPAGASNSEIWAAVREIEEANANVAPTRLLVTGQHLAIPDSVRDRYRKR